jgi:hypothetical protein
MHVLVVAGGGGVTGAPGVYLMKTKDVVLTALSVAFQV